VKCRGLLCVGHVAKKRATRNVYRILMKKHLDKRSHKRPRRKWEENINLDLGRYVLRIRRG
jgi:hypothetical protein